MCTYVSVLLDSRIAHLYVYNDIYTDIMLIYTSTVAICTYIKLSCCTTLKEIVLYNLNIRGSPDGSSKNPTCSAGDTRAAGLIPSSGRSPAGGNVNPL